MKLYQGGGGDTLHSTFPRKIVKEAFASFTCCCKTRWRAECLGKLEVASQSFVW